MRCHIDQEDGIKLETPPPNPKKRKQGSAELGNQLCDLRPPPKKAKYVRRHGKKANENKVLTGVKPGVDQLSKLLTSTQSQINASLNESYNTTFDRPYAAKNYPGKVDKKEEK